MRKVSTKLSSTFLTKTMKVESHIRLLYKQRPYEHSAHSKHHCVLPSLMFLLSSARSYPFLLQNTTSCFELTFRAYGHHGEISSKCFFSASFCYLRDYTHTLFFPGCPTSTTELSISVLRPSPFRCPSPSLPLSTTVSI